MKKDLEIVKEELQKQLDEVEKELSLEKYGLTEEQILNVAKFVFDSIPGQPPPKPTARPFGSLHEEDFILEHEPLRKRLITLERSRMKVHELSMKSIRLEDTLDKERFKLRVSIFISVFAFLTSVLSFFL
jgi:hypothetical protein